jgi:hypothetical protein
VAGALRTIAAHSQVELLGHMLHHLKLAGKPLW